MSNNFYLSNENWRKAKNAVKANEAKEDQVYKISHAEPDMAKKIKEGKSTTKSGHSFGRYQTDLGQHPEKKNEMFELLSNSKKFTKNELETINSKLGKQKEDQCDS